MTIHNFHESLAYSHAQADAPWWGEVYRKAFPSLAAMVNVRDDGWAQRGGIDRVLTLAGGKTIYVDEKVRKEAYDDVALEYWSSFEHKRPGWVEKDLACDFIAYAWVPKRRCLLLPFLPLRAAWREHSFDWVTTCRQIRSGNPGYTTLSAAVPIDVLLSAMNDAMSIRWGA